MRITDLATIGSQYSDIFLQPHFDDVALSCGGLVASRRRSKGSCLVATVFGGNPRMPATQSAFVVKTHQTMGFTGPASEAVAARQREDKCACEVLGVDNFWIDLPEALYRYYEDFSELFGAIKPSDHELIASLVQLLNQMIDHAPAARIYAPLGIGGHVDHQIVRQAILQSNAARSNVFFYEDFPYVAHADVSPHTKRLGVAPQLEDISDTLYGVASYRCRKMTTASSRSMASPARPSGQAKGLVKLQRHDATWYHSRACCFWRLQG